MNLPHTLTAYPSIQDTDSDGNSTRRPGSAGVTVDGWLQPERAGTAEDTADPQATQARFTAYLAAECPRLDAFARIEYQGETFELTGEAAFLSNPDGSAAYWRAPVRRG